MLSGMALRKWPNTIRSSSNAAKATGYTKLMDVACSMGSAVCGVTCMATNTRKISQAIREQLDRVAHVTSLGMSNIPAIELAQRLVGIAPASLQHVFYSCDGSSAVEAALKIAFQYARLRFGPNSKKSRFVPWGSHTTVIHLVESASVALKHFINCSRHCCSTRCALLVLSCIDCLMALLANMPASITSRRWIACSPRIRTR